MKLFSGVTFQAPNSRWYSGAGIYRNVWMIRLPETHIPLDGIYYLPVETENGYDLTIDTEPGMGEQSLRIMNWNISCIMPGTVKLLAEAGKTGDFPGKTAPRRIGQGEDICGDSWRMKSPPKWDITDLDL